MKTNPTLLAQNFNEVFDIVTKSQATIIAVRVIVLFRNQLPLERSQIT